MAQIRLVVNTDLKQAKAAVNTLKTSFTDLAKQLSTITVNKNLTAQLNALTKYYDSVANAGARAAQQTRGTAANVETLRKGYANLINQLNTLQKQYASGTFDTTRKSIEQNFEAVKKLSQAQEVNGDEVKRLSGEYKKLAADVAQFRAEGEKLKTSDPFSPKQGDSIFRLQKQYASLLNSIKSAEQYYPKGTFDGIAKGAQEAVTGLQALGQEYTKTGTLSESSQKQLNTFSDGLNKQRAAFETTKNSAQNYHGTLRDIIQGFIKFQLAASIVMNSIQLIRSAFNSLNETLVETEKVVVSIQRVLDETVEGGEIADKLYDIAERLGQTFDNVQEIAQNFAKAGLSWQETLEATEAAVLALNVAELTAEESSEGLIAVMQQFNYEASELVNVIDVLNKAADKSAVDTQELLVALQKTGSYAAAANLSLEQTVGLISALSEATAASGQNIGNALKSLFSYTTRDSSLDTFASLSEDMNKVVEEYRLGAASILDVWEQLSHEMQSLSAEQADALSQWTESSGLDAELEGELSEIYDSLTGVYDSAGVYRKNYFIALMNNFEEVKEVMGEISDASGYTAEEQAKYMDTYEAKLNSLQAKWQHLANDEQGWLAFKKGLLDIGSALLTVIEWTGGLRTTVIALSTVLWTVFGNKIISAIKNFGTAVKALFTNFKLATAGAMSFGNAINSVLGIVGIVGTVVSALVGVFQKAEEEAKAAREEIISTWNTSSDTATELASLYNELEHLYAIQDRTAEQESSYATIQENIIDLLGERANKLNSLTAGTEEYIQVLKTLAQEELKAYAQQAQAAKNVADQTFTDAIEEGIGGQVAVRLESAWDSFWGSHSKETLRLFSDLEKNGFSVDRRWGTLTLAVADDNDSFNGNKIDENDYDYITSLKDFLYQYYPESDIYNEIYSIWNILDSAIRDKIEVYAQSEALNALLQGGISSEDQLEDIIDSVISDAGVTSSWYSEIKEIIVELTHYTDEVEEAIEDTETLVSAIETLSTTALESLVEALESARDLEEESLDLEEKKLAVIEAQKELEDAMNNRSVRRLNAETGQWEWVSDEAEIADAEENLQEAIDALNEYVEEQAWDSVIDELENGNATNESILAILSQWLSESYGDDTPSWLATIIDTIKSETGIDLTQADEEGRVTQALMQSDTYDSGGVANGLGYLTKATSAPESVNDPELTRKILTPTSNTQFDRYVRDMGIMFETARTYAQSPVVQSMMGNTTTNNTDNSIVINGMKIGTDMMNRPFGEVISMMSLVPRQR